MSRITVRCFKGISGSENKTSYIKSPAHTQNSTVNDSTTKRLMLREKEGPKAMHTFKQHEHTTITSYIKSPAHTQSTASLKLLLHDVVVTSHDCNVVDNSSAEMLVLLVGSRTRKLLILLCCHRY